MRFIGVQVQTKRGRLWVTTEPSNNNFQFAMVNVEADHVGGMSSLGEMLFYGGLTTNDLTRYLDPCTNDNREVVTDLLRLMMGP